MDVKRYYYSFCQKAIEHIYGVKENDLKVFMFHQVTDDKSKWQDVNCAITLKGFQDFLERIKQSGIEFGRIDNLDINIKDIKNYITFDDVFEDAVENAFPILISEGIPFCVFISTGLIGKEGYITTEQLKLLATEPLCTIGFHTQSHKMMRFLSEEAVAKEIDKEPLETLIAKRVDYFAYPYGSYYAVAKEDVQCVNASTYRLAFSTIRASINEKVIKELKGFLPRINVNEKNYGEYI